MGEYNPAVDMCGDRPMCDHYGKKELEADMKMILTDKSWTDSVIGMSFFQFQQPYCKDGHHELQYGMYQMRSEAPWGTGYIEGDSAKDHPINCLDGRHGSWARLWPPPTAEKFRSCTVQIPPVQ